MRKLEEMVCGAKVRSAKLQQSVRQCCPNDPVNSAELEAGSCCIQIFSMTNERMSHDLRGVTAL